MKMQSKISKLDFPHDVDNAGTKRGDLQVIHFRVIHREDLRLASYFTLGLFDDVSVGVNDGEQVTL